MCTKGGACSPVFLCAPVREESVGNGCVCENGGVSATRIEEVESIAGLPISVPYVLSVGAPYLLFCCCIWW